MKSTTTVKSPVSASTSAKPTEASTCAILAVDLGKYKSVACFYDAASGEYRMATIEMSRGNFRRLLMKWRPAVAVIEACALAG